MILAKGLGGLGFRVLGLGLKVILAKGCGGLGFRV